MARRLHLVFGGELLDPTTARFRDLEGVEVVGLFPDYRSAFDAWKEASQRTVDNALMRYFIARLGKVDGKPVAATAEDGPGGGGPDHD